MRKSATEAAVAGLYASLRPLPCSDPWPTMLSQALHGRQGLVDRDLTRAAILSGPHRLAPGKAAVHPAPDVRAHIPEQWLWFGETLPPLLEPSASARMRHQGYTRRRNSCCPSPKRA